MEDLIIKKGQKVSGIYVSSATMSNMGGEDRKTYLDWGGLLVV